MGTRRVARLGPECPECGIQAGKCLDTGADDEGHVFRYRHCRGCEARYTTVEIALPGASFYHLDVERKMYQKLLARKIRGYWGQKARKLATAHKLHISWRVVGDDGLVAEEKAA